jgi:hypothetical protein
VDVFVRSPSLPSLSVFAPRAPPDAFLGNSANGSNRSIMRRVVRFMACPHCMESRVLETGHVAFSVKVADGGLRIAYASSSAGAGNNGRECRAATSGRAGADVRSWTHDETLRPARRAPRRERRLRTSFVRRVWPEPWGGGFTLASGWQSPGSVVPILAEVVLTGWTRIGLIGPEMAQKRSSPFLYRWPAWSGRGELARMTA